MSSKSRTVLLALAAGVSALDLSATSEFDGSAWGESVSPASTRSISRWNRPAKRQSGWEPPSNLASPLQEVWDHCVDTYTDGLFGFKNYGWDQLFDNEG